MTAEKIKGDIIEENQKIFYVKKTHSSKKGQKKINNQRSF